MTLDSGYHLVLAPPGCGKTDILAEVVRALSCGVSLNDMLCLTFTNRAARGMRSRILERLQSSGEMSLFVGNVHRFRSHPL
ncbi:UvrD-helicase domain-containing protein [Phocaeicola vulgatus]|uniref:UvrD-helicase domain-containing protein n=1 Tax=Phocaeicola vulgatus TaxID=821 RepID=UPI00374DFF6D